MNRIGKFIVVDGLTGSGKSTVLTAVHDWAHTCGHKIFRLQDWKESTPPRYEDISMFDVFFTYEPTRTWIGSAIRYELSNKTNPYGGEELAQAFALDRQIQYKRLILPALTAGKIVIQDRSVSSSLIYQPIMEHSVSLETIMDLPGNKLALDHAPDALILTQLGAQTAYDRIQARDDESKGVFADLNFLKKQEERYQSEWFRNLFESRGTTIHTLDTSGTLEQSKENATNLINQILTTC